MSATKLIRLAKHFEYKYNFKQAQQVTEPDPFENYVKNYYNNRMTNDYDELPKKPSITPELSEKQKALHDVLNIARDRASSVAAHLDGNLSSLFSQLSSSLNRLKYKVTKNIINKNDIDDVQKKFDNAIIAHSDSKKKAPSAEIGGLIESLKPLKQYV